MPFRTTLKCALEFFKEFFGIFQVQTSFRDFLELYIEIELKKKLTLDIKKEENSF